MTSLGVETTTGADGVFYDVAWIITAESLCQEVWFCFLFKNILFILRESGGGRRRGRETSVCGCLSGTPNWGPG